MVHEGYGQHISVLNRQERVRIAFLNVVCNWIFPMTFALPKLAIVALLERLLSLQLRTRIVFWSLSIVLLVSSFLLSILWYVQCTPRVHQWDPSVPGECWNPDIITNYSLYIAALSATLDVLFALFPPFVIAGLNMTLYKRIIISTILASGLVAAVVVVYKTTLLAQMSQTIKADRTWSGAPIMIWTIIEGDVLVVVASLPTIGPFIHLIREKADGIISRQEAAAAAHRATRNDRQSRRPTWRPIGMLYSGVTRLSSNEGTSHGGDVERANHNTQVGTRPWVADDDPV